MLVNCQITVTTIIGTRAWQENTVEYSEETGAVYLRRPDKFCRECGIIVSEKERSEAQAVDHVYEHQTPGRTGYAEECRAPGPWV